MTELTELPGETRDLLTAALRHPDGAAPLWEAQLECAAALYQVKPARLEALRRALPLALPLTQPRHVERDQRPPLPAPPPDALEVIALAATRPDGLELLRRAPVETAAILFGAHVFAVEAARQLLEQGAAAQA